MYSGNVSRGEVLLRRLANCAGRPGRKRSPRGQNPTREKRRIARVNELSISTLGQRTLLVYLYRRQEISSATTYMIGPTFSLPSPVAE
jgi:hypothetical protein